MISLFINTKKEDIVVLDIRDGSVGGMILSVDSSGKSIPEKVYSIRRHIPFQRNFNYRRLFYLTAQAIIYVSGEIMKSGLIKKPNKVFCIIGPHLHISQVRLINKDYGSTVSITEDMLLGMIREDARNFDKRHLELGGDSSKSILEHKVMQIKLNGYETKFPINKKAKTIELSVFVSFVPQILLNDISKIILKNLHTNNIEFHSFTFVFSDTIRGIVPEKQGFIAVNVEEEISEISVLRDGTVEDVVSFPVGTSMLTRIIMDRFSVSYDQALSFIKIYMSGSGDHAIMSKMAELVDRARIIWTDQFYQALKKISYRHLLPDTFYFVTDDVCKDIIFDFIKKAEVSNLLIANKPPQIECLEPKIFANLCKNISECPDDVHFVIGAVFSNKIEKDKKNILGSGNILNIIKK